MARILLGLVAGSVFGLGLAISQMINPAKVIGFLDLFGRWDPSLLVVMVTAIPVAWLGYRLGRFRSRPLYASAYTTPTRITIDSRLMVGAVIFGIGWGLVGYCPGPAFASIGFGNQRTAVFIVAMLAGMIGQAGFESFLQTRLRHS
jgi:uncharacterized membrane protein YedE/YeeE